MRSFVLPASLLGMLLSVGVFAGACVGDPPDPGFEELGGGGGGSAGPVTTGTTASNTTGTGSNSSAQSSSSSSSSSASSSASTGSLGCNDLGPGEPNNTESTAYDLGTITDCDNAGGSVSGLLAGTMDADWYKYFGTDTFGCQTNPHRTLTASHPLRICKFFQCLDNQANDFSCPNGTQSATSPDGRAGCCGTSGFDLGLTCGSSSLNNDEAWVYIRLDTQQNQCVTYSLSYGY